MSVWQEIKKQREQDNRMRHFPRKYGEWCFLLNKRWRNWGMRNRVVKQLLMVCMATTLSVSVPVVSWGADDTETIEQENKESDSINILKKGVETSIYKDKKLTISMYSATYTLDASDIILNMSVKNSYPNILTLKIQDAKVDDKAIAFTWDSNDYKAGTVVDSSWYIALEDLQALKCSDFKKLAFVIIGTLNDGTEVFQKEITMERDAFKSVADESSDSSTEEDDDTTEDNVSTENTSSEESQSDDKYDELLQKIEELEAKNAELEDKLNKTEEAEPTATPEPTEAPAEETPTPEPTEAPETEPAQEEAAAEEAVPEEEPKPVVEYKDATTIRIVQQALNDAGYNCGNPDGVAGGKTTEAVTKYQTDKGLTVNGLITDELLQALNVVEKVQDAVQKEASKAEYSSDYTYDQLARNPDTYKGQKMKFTGKVLEAGNDDDICYARIELNSNIDTILFVTYKSDLLGYRLLDDDNITVYGTSLGVYSYKSVGAGTITIPWLNADMIEM